MLIVGEESDTAESLAILLKLRGLNARTADAVHDAIEIARRERTNCMLLHIGAPGLESYEVARQIRRELAGSIILIALVDCHREGEGREAFSAGFDRHVVKPIDRDGLHSLLTALDDAATGPRLHVEPPPSPDEAGPSPRTAALRVVVSDPLGLHLRVAGRFVALAGRFTSEVRVHRDGRSINGRSILDLATLAAGCGDCIDLEVAGPDADEALEALAGLLSCEHANVGPDGR